MNVTKARIIALLVGILVIGTAALYLANFLAHRSAKSSLETALTRGIEWFEKGQYDEARVPLEECYHGAPGGNLKSRATLFLARCYTAENESKKAADFWAKVLDDPLLQDHHAEAFYSLARLVSGSDTPDDKKRAQGYYQKAAAARPGSRFSDLAEIAIAEQLLARGDLPAARTVLQKLKDAKKDYPELRKASFKLSMKLLFSPTIAEVPKSEYYAVKQGDTLEGIAKRFGTTAELLEESNGVTPRRLQIGKRLKVVTGGFLLKVSKSKNTLQLMSENMVLNEYPIGTGKFGKTPVGRFKISDKVKEPPWFKDGRVIPYGNPENVLGTRWMKLESIDGQTGLSGYGIHGTDDETSIGKESSEGCIRLKNRDVEELYKIVTVGTEVIIGE